MAVSNLATFGDVRRLILDTVEALRDGKMAPNLGMAIAANMKVLNDNVQVEINAAKLSLLTEGRAHNFGRVTSMGRKLIGNDSDPTVVDSQ
jgi:hypothetical protein